MTPFNITTPKLNHSKQTQNPKFQLCPPHL